MIRSGVLASTYRAGLVQRYHTWPTTRKESVAEHTFCVLQIYRQIWGLSPRVVEYILDHDLPEFHVGDLPFPAKRDNPALKEACSASESVARDAMGLLRENEYGLTDLELTRVKVADLLSMWQFGLHELMLGNAFASPIVQDTAENVSRLLAGNADHSNVIQWMRSQK